MFIVCIIGLKSCFVSAIHIDEYIVAKNTDKNGQQCLIVLFPPNGMICTKTYGNIEESGLYKLQGEYAKHYIGDLYCIGSFPWGLSYLNEAEKVFDVEMTLREKQGDSFPNIGEKIRSKIIIYKDKISIGSDIFNRIKISDDMKNELELKLKEFKDLLK